MPRIKILQPWTNGGTDYEVGQNLDLKYQKDCDELISKGIAESATEVKSVEEVNELNDQNMEIAVKAATEKALAVEPKIEKKVGQVVHDRSDDNKEYLKTGGYEHFGKFIYDVHQAGLQNASKTLRDWKAKTAGILSGTDDASGGYLIPREFNSSMLETQIETAIVRPKAQFIPMQTNTINIPACVSTTHATSVFGGIIMYKTAEGSQLTKSKPKFGQVGLNLSGLTGMTFVTDQLIEDSPISIEPILGTKFAQALAWQEDEEFINGSGVGGPLGVLNAPCLISVTKETAQDADTIVYENIIKMYSRLHPMSMKNAVWLVNANCLPQLMTMSLDIGTGGSAVYIPAGGASAAPYGTLLGRPVIVTEHCKTVGDKGDIVLADFTQYLIGGKSGGGVKTATSSHLRFDYSEQAFKIESRYDGQPWWTSPLTPKNGSTSSPFVTLAAR